MQSWYNFARKHFVKLHPHNLAEYFPTSEILSIFKANFQECLFFVYLKLKFHQLGNKCLDNVFQVVLYISFQDT